MPHLVVIICNVTKRMERRGLVEGCELFEWRWQDVGGHMVHDYVKE